MQLFQQSKKLIGDGGKVILCSHLGKPKGEPKPELSLAPVAKRLTELLGQEVKFAADPEVVGPNAKAAVEAMNDGDVVLLEKHVIAQKKQRTETNSAKNLLLFVMYLLMMHLVQLTEHIALMLVLPNM